MCEMCDVCEMCVCDVWDVCVCKCDACVEIGRDQEWDGRSGVVAHRAKKVFEARLQQKETIGQKNKHNRFCDIFWSFR